MKIERNNTMQLHVNILLLVLGLGSLSLLISVSLGLGRFPTLAETKWTVMFLLALLLDKFFQSLNDLLNTTWINPKVKKMQLRTLSQEEFSKMPIVGRYQHFARKRFQEVENIYYSHIDELDQKLRDLNEINEKLIPDFTLHNFSFVEDWQWGDVNSEYVYGLLKGMNLPDVAEKTVCRRLRNFMEGKETSAPDSHHYIKAVHDKLKVTCVPAYLNYLSMLRSYFEKMYLIDKTQVKLTWIQQTWGNDGVVKAKVRDITLNQMSREIDAGIMPHNEHKYTVGDNVVVFDEDLLDDGTTCHWIFGPKEYIAQIRQQFKVVEKIDLEDEKDYIRKLIGTFIS